MVHLQTGDNFSVTVEFAGKGNVFVGTPTDGIPFACKSNVVCKIILSCHIVFNRFKPGCVGDSCPTAVKIVSEAYNDCGEDHCGGKNYRKNLLC